MFRAVMIPLFLATPALAFDPSIDSLPVKDFDRLPTTAQFEYAGAVARANGLKQRSNVVACLGMMGEDPRYENYTVMQMIEPCVDGIKKHWE